MIAYLEKQIENSFLSLLSGICSEGKESACVFYRYQISRVDASVHSNVYVCSFLCVRERVRG